MPTIKKPNQHFDTTLHTGNGGTQSVTNAGGFSPDFVWIKNRSRDGADPYYGVHMLFNTITGAGNRLMSQSTTTEVYSASSLTAFNSNGFSVGSDLPVNRSGDSFVGWQWKAGGASTVNTSGSISSNVSVNATAGFSVVTYTNSAGRNAHTVGHGLGVAPKMFFIKTRSATADWPVYHASLGATKAVYLNSTLAEQTNATFFNNTSPSSTVITLGSGLSDAGVTIVAYCWAEVEGYSKFGSYVANASSDGPFIYTGFRPRWIMFKRSTSATNWYIIDTAISPYNASTTGLYPNTSDAESTEGAVDILSNGFKCRVSSGGFNFPSGQTFLYAAFAESPLKYSNAR